MLNRTRGHSFRPRATGQCVVLTIFTGRTESAVWARRASTRPTGTPNRRRHVPSAWALSVGVKRGNNIVRWHFKCPCTALGVDALSMRASLASLSVSPTVGVLTQNLFVEAISWTTKLPWIDLVQSPQGGGFRNRDAIAPAPNGRDRKAAPSLAGWSAGRQPCEFSTSEEWPVWRRRYQEIPRMMLRRSRRRAKDNSRGQKSAAPSS